MRNGRLATFGRETAAVVWGPSMGKMVTTSIAMRCWRTVSTAFVLSLVLVLSGCSDGAPAASDDQDFNDADVAFASDMIQHHAQANQMVDLTLGRKLDPEVAALAEQIRTTQVREIATMADWLQGWDKPVPETIRDHANSHGGEMSSELGSELPGMMDAQEMQGLEEAKGPEFQQMWLQMMIAHHEGAIEMAQTEQADGTHQGATGMAEQVEAAQNDEIKKMQDLLAP